MQIPVRIVLVETTHPGNIGAAARAMKTMGLYDLALVRPRCAFPSDEATARATGATDILENARVYDSLPEAIADCGFVVGTSARERAVEWPTLPPRDCAAQVLDALDAGNRAAIVFGPEKYGLTNEALARCAVHVRIPTNPEFSSLNLAMAVQLLCYELRLAALDRARADERGETSGTEPQPSRVRPRLATVAELGHFYDHLDRVLVESGFLRADHQRQLRLKLRRIFQRAALDKNEVDILRGVLTSLEPSRYRVERSES